MKAIYKTVGILMLLLAACVLVGAIVFFGVNSQSETGALEYDGPQSNTDKASDIFGSEVRDNRNLSPIKDIPVPKSPTTLNQKIIGVHDVAIVVAGVYVAVVIVYFWVSHTLRERKDPTKQWLK